MSRTRFRLTKRQAQGLANAVRATSWIDQAGGDHTITVVHPPSGTEVTITIAAPTPPTMTVIRGFTNSSNEEE